jgi:hypothetical protein
MNPPLACAEREALGRTIKNWIGVIGVMKQKWFVLRMTVGCGRGLKWDVCWFSKTCMPMYDTTDIDEESVIAA